MPDFPSARLGTLAALCAVLLLRAAPAAAAAGEHEVWLGAGLSADSVALDARYLFDMSDFWSFGGGLEQRLGWSVEPGRSAALAEVRMVIDALTFVPALSLTGGVAMDWPSSTALGLARLEASIAWRPARAWGLLLRIGLEQQMDASATRAMLISLAWGRYLGGASELDL